MSDEPTVWAVVRAVARGAMTGIQIPNQAQQQFDMVTACFSVKPGQQPEVLAVEKGLVPCLNIRLALPHEVEQFYLQWPDERPAVLGAAFLTSDVLGG